QHAARRGFELFKEFASGRAATLNEKIHFSLVKKFLHFTGDLLHVTVAGEKDKGAPVGFLDEMRDPTFELFLISGVARVRHLLHDEDFHLLLEIERAAELQGFGFSRTNAITEISEIGAPDRQRRARHDAGGVVPENHSLQNG